MTAAPMRPKTTPSLKLCHVKREPVFLSLLVRPYFINKHIMYSDAQEHPPTPSDCSTRKENLNNGKLTSQSLFAAVPPDQSP